MSTAIVCEGCGKDAPTLQCPTCKKIGYPPSFFCGQECFKSNWAKHKEKHSKPPECTINTMTDVERSIFNFTGTLRPGKITPKRPVPADIPRPDYADNIEGRSKMEENDRASKPKVFKGKSLDAMKKVCELSREVLDAGCAIVKADIATDDIDRVIHEATVARKMYPSPLNYYNFPKSVCTSVNEIICHGIPDSRVLENSDIVNLDVSCFFEGFHGDLNETVFVGKPKPEVLLLVHCAYKCLMDAIATVKPGMMYKHVGDVVEARAAKNGLSVVRTYSGHGIGEMFHCSPNVPHYAGNKAGGIMQEGHVFTIEPMINMGSWHDVTWPDKWTSSTRDGKWSAQFEHTMVVTKTGVELLTGWKDDKPFYQRQLEEWGIDLPKIQ